ncbi:AAA domain-containing protein [Paraoerskovia marina]|uniref:AAA domain-containing protein n=1 Tax=Paraoerskovia marina TaxID=545619 RepID=A0A1H1PF42_9CELL|nr:ATP-binding protein [Paraoerskovia marina]SDS09710.1 AAA domain-containing protein [Paraoerskovia marina]
MSNYWAEWLRIYDTDHFTLSRKQGWDRFVNSAPREEFATLSRTQMGRLSKDERRDYNEARMVWNANLPTVRTSQLAHANSIIDMVLASARRDGDKLRGSVVIDAEPGLGKTTIATRYGRAFHRDQHRRYGTETPEGHQFLPVAFIPIAAQTTLKGLNQRLLNFYGHPAAKTATKDRLAVHLVDVVGSCQTRLIIIDDIHFVDFRNRNGTEMSNHLKWLANELPVTFVFAGVDLEQKRFFDEGLTGEEAVLAQTARRATRVQVAPFSIASDAGMTAWIAILRAFGTHLKLADGDGEMLVPLAHEIHRRTQGRVASLTNMLDRASYLAIRSGTERITDDVLAKVRVDNAGENGARRL